MAVRREAVLLELEDKFTREMLAAAAATRATEAALKDLDGTTVSTTRATEQSTTATQKSTKATERYTLATAIAEEKMRRMRQTLREYAKDAVDAERGVTSVAKSNDSLAASAVRGASSIDRYSGRMGLLLKTAAALGPAIIPIGAVGIQALAGLASQLGFATLGMSSLLIAAQGVGNAISAVEKARLDPTVANIQAAREALSGLAPAAQDFVARFEEFRPVLADIRNAAAAGFFPGLIDALDSFERIAPNVADLMQILGTTGGNLISDAAEALAGPEWSQFMAFLEREAPRAFEELGHTVGNVARGMAELWMAFTPLNQDFSSWMLDASRGFAQWADGLSQTQGFREFISYLRENGPLVADATVAVANAILQIVQAAAPLGGPVLRAITAFAEAVATIADNPLGTPIMAAVTAMSALSLATNVATAATLRLKAAQATLAVGGGAKGAPAGGAAPGVVGGGVASGLALIGLIDTAPDYIQNLQMMADGERNVVEGFARMAAGANPVGAALNLLGVDVLGVSDDSVTLGRRLVDAARDAAQLSGATRRTSVPIRDLSGNLATAQRQMLRGAAASDRLREALKQQRADVKAVADGWFDYSQKIVLAAGPSMDTLLRRWDRIGDAAADLQKNVRDALQRGIDPKVLKNVIDTLGPQGAAVALEQFANATGAEARRIARNFQRMSDGVSGLESTYDALTSLINGNPLSLNPRGIVGGAKKGEQSIIELSQGVSGAILGMHDLDQQHPKPTADLNFGPLASGVNAAENLVMRLNGVTSTSTAYINTIRTTYYNTVHQPGAGAGGFGPVGSADGGTVPKTGRGYADRHHYLLADGEEVISNRHGQADRHRALLKAINANRGPGMSRASERRVGSEGRQAAGGTVRHLFEVRVTGEMDLERAKAQLVGVAEKVSQSTYDQNRAFEGTRRGDRG